jgi:hypothetical protein
MALDWDTIAAQVEGVMASAMRAVEPVADYAFTSARHSSV